MSGRVNFGRSLCWLCLKAATLFCASVLLFSSVLRAEGPAANEVALRQKVDRLLADLDAEARSVRTAARESLLALGPAILPLLPEEAALGSAAARDAVRSIRSRLQRQSALETLSGTHVNLQGRFSLSEILHRMSMATGNQFDFAALDPALLRRQFVVDNHAASFLDRLRRPSQESGAGLRAAAKPRKPHAHRRTVRIRRE